MEALRSQPVEPAPNPTLLAGLQEQIRRWEAQQNEREAQAELRRKIARELTPFIGDMAVARLLAAVSVDARNLLSTFEPVLARFLGVAAASELVSHLVDAAIY
jgi:hypothetical protein